MCLKKTHKLKIFYVSLLTTKLSNESINVIEKLKNEEKKIQFTLDTNDLDYFDQTKMCTK